MTEPATPDLPHDDRRYDLFLRLPPGADAPALIAALMQQLSLSQDKAERLLQHLASHGSSRVRRDLGHAEAEQTAANFRAAGLETELKSTLSLLAKEAANPETACPSCQRLMRPSPQRQCPYCGIYLDKIDHDKLRLQQIRDEELRKLNKRLQREDTLNERQLQEDSERALRERIRAELERELGLHRPWQAFFRGSRGVLRVGLIASLLGATFWGGHLLGSQGGGLALTPQAALMPGVLGQVMAGGGGAQAVDLAAFAQSPAGAALPAGSSDSLLLPGTVAPSPEWQAVTVSLQASKTHSQAVLGEKQQLALQLVVALAQAGQAQRASELLTRLQAAPGYQAESARAEEMLATTWLLLHRPGGVNQQALDAQVALLAKLPAPQAATVAARVAAVLASSPSVAPAHWQAWLALADKYWQQTSAGAMRDYTASQLQRWHGQSLLNAVLANAGAGRWQVARQHHAALRTWLAAHPGLVASALALQAATALGEADKLPALQQQLSVQALQAISDGDATLQLQQLADHLGDVNVSTLLPQLALQLQTQAPKLQPLLYSSLASLAAASGQSTLAAQYQQQLALGLGASEERDARILALSVRCTTQLAHYYQQSRQPALAEQQLRKAAAVVVPLLPAAAAAA